MRKQYYFRNSERGLLAWDVDRLVVLSRDSPRKHVPLAQIRELDQPCGANGAALTWRALSDHIRLVNDADLAFPIILAANGEVMDGRHRLAKAVLEGRDTIDAVQFDVDPNPDYVGRASDELPYD